MPLSLRLFFSFLCLGGLGQAQFLIDAFPADGARNVPRNTRIGLAFRGPVNSFDFPVTFRKAGTTTPILMSLVGLGSNDPLYPALVWRVFQTLDANTAYETEFTDQNGRQVVRFTTGTELDTSAPKIVSVEPEDGATDVDPYAPIRVTFDKPISGIGQNPVQNSGGSFSYALRRAANRPGWQTVDLVPEYTGLPPLQQAVRLVPQAFLDMSGNAAAPTGEIVRQWDTSLRKELGPVQLVGQHPMPGETGVPTNTTIQLLFDRATPYLANPSSIVFEGGGARLVPSGSGEGRVLFLNVASLAPNTSYKVTIGTDALGGQRMALESPIVFEFTTGSGPLVVVQPTDEVTPGYSATERYPLNTKMVLRSSTPLPAFAPRVVTGTMPVTSVLLEDRRTLVMESANLPPFSAVAIQFNQLRDILGRSVGSAGLSMRTNAAVDREAPAIVATTPVDGASNVPVNSAIRILLSERISLLTSLSAFRLLKNGSSVVDARVSTAPRSYYDTTGDFVDLLPVRPLDPDTEYVIETGSVLDLASNASAPKTIRFRTGVAVANPPFPRLLKMTGQTEEVGPQETLELEFDQPLSQAMTRLTAEFVVSVRGDSPRRFGLPAKLEFAGNTVRVIPLAGWPANRRVSLTLSSQDLYGRDLSIGNSFVVGRATDNQQPEIVSVTPAPGTLINDTVQIRIEFSKPMFGASELNGGMLFSDSVGRSVLRGEWSGDLKSYSFEAAIPNYQDVYPSKFSLTLSPALTDLAGNPIRPVTLAWPVGPRAIPATGPPFAVVKVWPSKEIFPDALLSGFQPIHLLLSRPVDAATLNRSLWVVNQGRMEGIWATEGELATFTPSVAWRQGGVLLLPLESILNLPEGLGLRVPATAERGNIARVLGTSLTILAPHPLDAVLEVQFDRDPPPTGAMQVIAAPPSGFQQMVPVATSETRVRPGVMRYQPVNPLPLRGIAAIRSIPNSPAVVSYTSSTATVAAAENPPVSKIRYLSPAPEATEVPRNAVLSVMLDGGLNPITLESAVTMSVLETGAAIPLRLEPYNAITGALQIWPQIALPANSWIAVKIDGWMDRMGRPLPATEWKFQTNQKFEISTARLLASPTTGLNTVLTVDPFVPISMTFDRPLDPVRTRNAFRFSNNNAMLDWILSADLRTLTLTPPALGWNRGERFEIRFACVDYANNYFSTNLLFQTPFDASTAPLELISSSLRDGDSGLPLNLRIGLRFSEAPNGDSPSQVYLRDASGQRITLRRTGFNLTSKAVQLLPEVLLEPNASYELTVGSIVGGAGRPLANPRTIRFRTGAHIDLTPPESAIRFGLTDEPIVVRFSEPMDPTGLVEAPLTWIDWRGGSGFTRVVPVRSEWSEDRQTVTITPLEPMRNLEHELKLGRVEDLAGNAGTGTSLGTFEYRFTPPVTLPALPQQSAVMFSPADGSANVPLNVRMLVRLNLTASGRLAVRLFENGVLTDASIEVSGTAANISYGLVPGRQYRIEVAAFSDIFGRSFPAQSATFTTGSQRDNSRLQLVSSSPATGAAGVGIDTPWTATFNKPLAPVLGFRIPPASRAMPFGVRYAFDREKVTATPSPAWPAAASIRWDFGQLGGFDLLTDWAGNQMLLPVSINMRTAAINDPTPPKLLSVSPEPGTLLNPGPLASITLRFSKPVSLSYETVQLFQGSTRGTPGLVYSDDYATVTISFLPEANSRVTILGSDAIRDNADNPLAPFVLEYPTGDAVPYGYPTWTLLEPTNTQRAPANTPVRLRFDRVMDVASAQGSIRLTENGQNVEGTVTASADGKIFTFQSASRYAAGSTVRVTVLATMRDLAGLPVQSQSYGPGASFLVEPATTTAAPFAVAKRGFHATAPANGVLEVEFNRDLDVESIQMDSVWLRHGSLLVAGTPSLRDGRILRFEPSEPLVVGETYVLTAGSALRSVTGEAFAGQDLRFTAAEALQGDAEVASTEEIEWGGRPAIRVRMTQPLSRLSLPEAAGAEVLPDVDAHAFVVVPGGDAQTLTLHFERSVDAAGRMLKTKRRTIERKAR